ncbi:50S ribosomal protein L18a [Candidatus Micrarchaeota archaeon]|nr:50S ribosomal protein L18a [Candidatus Micrarchaeota archaeon]MBU1929925.1 50S ribosomal protein L18a [Candidatus Micrarchaeota archaeon]
MKNKKNSQKELFTVIGQLKEKKEKKKFSKTVLAFNERNAMEKILTLFGSKNKISRRNIWIEEAKPTKEV